MYRKLIGKKSIKVKNIVEKGMVRKFANAIGDPHPIYIDEMTGINSKYGVNIAPPTFPRVLDYGEINGLKLPENGLIHGEQKYFYQRPLLVGEEIHCYSEVENYTEKMGNNGLMGILTVVNYGENDKAEIIFSEKMTTIITETVRKAMNE